MCDPAITPEVPRADKLVCNAKVFIDGKNRPLHVTESHTELTLRLNDPDARVLTVTNLNGEVTTLPRERVVSIVANEHLPERVDISQVAFDGFRFQLRGLTATAAAELGIAPATNAVLVTAEDLAEAEILVYDLTTGELLWTNPAEPLRGIKRVVKAVRLFAEAKALFDESMTPRVPEHGKTVAELRDAYGVEYTEDQLNALAFLERGEEGDRTRAIACTNVDFVARVEAEGLNRF